MTSRTSKIGRLPKTLRHQLGLRIEDNHSGVDLVQWLNGLPEVQEIIADQFNGSPISEQNLSDWKQSGHLDWLRHEAAVESARHFLETSDGLDEVSGDQSLPDRFAAILGIEMMRTGLALLQKETDLEKKWKLACQLNRELSRLRRDDDRAKRTALDQANPNSASHRQNQPGLALAHQAAVASHLVTQALDRVNQNDDRTRLKLPDNLSNFETAAHLYPTKSHNLPINGTSKPQQNGKNPG